MTRKKIKVMLLACLFLLIAALPGVSGRQLSAQPLGDEEETFQLRGRVLTVEDVEPDEAVRDFIDLEQLATVEITRGEYKGEQHTLLNALTGHPLFDLYLTPGRHVILWGEKDSSGALRQVYLQDFARDGYLYILLSLFVVALLVVGRRKGMITILTLSMTIFAVFRVLLPLLLAGYSPVGMTVLVATAISLVTITLISGLGKKSAAASVGTVGGVVIAGLLALLVGSAAKLTGFSSEEAQMLLYMEAGALDVRGLLFAGIIIGSLGAVMDVSMSIATSAFEIYCTDPAISFSRLFGSAMNVGRDIMGTMANTLILAYVGTTVPLLLLFMGYQMPWASIINSDLVATEVVRALTGSIGLVASIPLTAFVSGMLLTSARGKAAGTGVLDNMKAGE
jgi:uncharacterized membrane protein